MFAFLLSDGAKTLSKTITLNEMGTDAQLHDETWRVIINALIQRFWTKIKLKNHMV